MNPAIVLLVDGGAFVLVWLVCTLTPEHWTGVHRTALAIWIGDLGSYAARVARASEVQHAC